MEFNNCMRVYIFKKFKFRDFDFDLSRVLKEYFSNSDVCCLQKCRWWVIMDDVKIIKMF